MYLGQGSFWNGKASRAERGLEISMIAVVDVEQAMGYSLSVQQTPASEPNREQPAERTRVDDYLDHLRATRAALPAAVRYLVGDGFYSKLKWVEGVIALNLEVIGKLRCDANLKYLYDGPQKPRGARRKYDGKVDLTDLSRWQSLGKDDNDISLYTAIVWSVSLKRKIRVVYLVNHKHHKKLCYALLFSTDIDIDPIQLYEAYAARFQIEMCQPQYPHRHLADAAEGVSLEAVFQAFIFSYKVLSRLSSIVLRYFRRNSNVGGVSFPMQT